MDRLPISFYAQNVTTVAQSLLGKILTFGPHQSIILETEAYRGLDDPASHAFRGPTPRSIIMFGPPGFSYVYFIYGMYHCLNIVTEPEGNPSAVLIRSIQLLSPPHTLLSGPGKLCKFLGINKSHNALNLTTHPSFFVSEGFPISNITATPRIGISSATDKLWRFTTPPIHLP